MTYTPPSQLAFRTLVTPDVWNKQVADNISHLHDRIETIWVPVVTATPPLTFLNATVPVSALIDAANEAAGMSMLVPADFSTLNEILIWIVPVGSTTINYDLRAAWAAVGEVWNVNNSSSLAATLAMTANVLTTIDVTTMPTSLSANDLFQITIEQNGVNGAYVLGMSFKYQRI